MVKHIFITSYSVARRVEENLISNIDSFVVTLVYVMYDDLINPSVDVQQLLERVVKKTLPTT